MLVKELEDWFTRCSYHSAAAGEDITIVQEQSIIRLEKRFPISMKNHKDIHIHDLSDDDDDWLL